MWYVVRAEIENEKILTTYDIRYTIYAFMPHLDEDKCFQDILDKVKRERNLDFSQYRPAILKRRVMMRVHLTKTGHFDRYAEYLSEHPVELDNLLDSLTINVTEFFRDARVFDFVEHKIIPKLCNRHEINIWSCGCSSGEEAYSILILLAEHLGPAIKHKKIKIYATDIDNGSLKKGTEGAYEAYQFKNLSPQKKLLINKYFYDMGNKRFWIREGWPEYIDFLYHDACSLTPFKNIDAIFCRNMLIYFDRKLQEQVFEQFYNALKEGGFLVLGNVESIGFGYRSKFEEFDREARVYVKRENRI